MPETLTYADEFLLADAEMDWNKSRESTHGWLHHDGLFALFPLPHSHQWRIFADVAPQNGQEVPQASLELFQQLLVARTGDTQTTIVSPLFSPLWLPKGASEGFSKSPGSAIHK